MPLTAYLAGPEVFLPNATEVLAMKSRICRQVGIVPITPLDNKPPRHTYGPDYEARLIFRMNRLAMLRADIALVNLTPFRGPSADAGTLVELGNFMGMGKPAFGYTNSGQDFTSRSNMHRLHLPDPILNTAVESFEAEDNLMIPGAVEHCGGLPIVQPERGHELPFDSMAMFSLCARRAAEVMGLIPESAPSQFD